jgi:ribonuclease P protein component
LVAETCAAESTDPGNTKLLAQQGREATASQRMRTLAHAESVRQGAAHVGAPSFDLIPTAFYTVSVHEAHLPAESTPQEENARLPRADEHQRWSQDVEAASREGAETADSVGGRLRRPERLTTRAEFQALFRQGKRIERPSMIVLWRVRDGTRRAGFAVGRQIQGAVRRNRARRRLREAYRAARDVAPAGVDLVVIGRGSALTASLGALIDDMRAAFRAMASAGSRR